MGRFAPLRRPADFSQTMRAGRRVSDGGLRIYVRERDDGKGVRLGFIVRCKGAVTRNRIRRRLKEALAAAGAQGDIDIVVRADESLAGRKFQELVEVMGEATRRAA